MCAARLVLPACNFSQAALYSDFVSAIASVSLNLASRLVQPKPSLTELERDGTINSYRI